MLTFSPSVTSRALRFYDTNVRSSKYHRVLKAPPMVDFNINDLRLNLRNVRDTSQEFQFGKFFAMHHASRVASARALYSGAQQPRDQALYAVSSQPVSLCDNRSFLLTITFKAWRKKICPVRRIVSLPFPTRLGTRTSSPLLSTLAKPMVVSQKLDRR